MDPIRFGGLASGIDTDQIVKELMKAERMKVDKLSQDKQILEWKQEIYNDLNKQFADFILDTKKDFGLVSSTSTGILLNKSVSSLNWVKEATSSNEDIATVTARADAVEGSYDIKVHQLASNFSTASAESLGDFGILRQQFNLGDNDVVEFTITRTENGEQTISNTFSYTADDLSNLTIDDIAKQINSYRDENGNDLGVKAVYDKSINRFFFQSTKTGEENGFIVEEDTSNPDLANLFTGVDSLLKLNLTSGNQNIGQDAIIDFGAAKDIKQSSNQFAISGIDFNLKAEGDFTVQVKTDIDGVYDKISKFVETYNELVSAMNEKLSEPRYRNYRPLTEEQKDAMSEKEIERWEEKAKSGLIKNEGLIESTMQRSRSGMYEVVEGVTGSFNQLTQIGITTEGYLSGSRGGKLIINETELKEAIKNDVDGVLELLFKEPSPEVNESDSQLTAEQIKQKRSESGLVSRLYDNIVVGMKSIVAKSGAGENAELYRNVNSSIMIDFITEHSGISMLDKDTDNIAERIDSLNDYLVRKEDSYWKQFTAMEKAIQQMNSQSAWLMQQFGGGA